MYLQQGVGNMPYLNIRTDEPSLLYYWYNSFPLNAMSEVYKLDPYQGQAWYYHLKDFIVEHIGNAGPVNPATGSPTGGTVPARNRDRSEQLFEKWMQSSDDSELFKTVKLSAIKNLAGINSAALLIEDTYCLECEETEPAFIYLSFGNDGNLSFPINYAKIGTMFDKPLFGYPDEDGQPEMVSCHICRPGDSFVTENMSSLARRKFSQCKCAPCRGRL